MFCGASRLQVPDENQLSSKVLGTTTCIAFVLKMLDASQGYTCLIAKAPSNEAKLLAQEKGKAHRPPVKPRIDRYVTHPLHTLHMDLFGPTSVRSINHASYCLVITDDCSRVMLEFCGEKGIKQEFSNARTPQQNGVAERMNRTLIEAARSMLADSHLPTTFWAEAVNTACYTFNRLNPAGSKEVVDIGMSTEEAEERLWFSLLSRPRKASDSDTMLTKIDTPQRSHLLLPISKSAEDIKVNTGHMEAESPSAQNEEEVFSDDNEDEMPEIRIYDKSSEGIFEQASYDDDGVITNFNNLPDEKSARALEDVTGLNQMQEELLQFKLQQVWVLVDLPTGAKVIGTKWVYRNKKDERGVVVRNKARLVAQGHRQEEGD
ncbi:retrovirus-related pol polyprotein from transposon TNT 1-94 [Tanacetum coccineum]